MLQAPSHTCLAALLHAVRPRQDDFFFSPSHQYHHQTEAALAYHDADHFAPLPAGAGEVCLWNPCVVHYGGGCEAGAPEEPRVSVGGRFRRGRGGGEGGGAGVCTGICTEVGVGAGAVGGGGPLSQPPPPLTRREASATAVEARLRYVATAVLKGSRAHWYSLPLARLRAGSSLSSLSWLDDSCDSRAMKAGI